MEQNKSIMGVYSENKPLLENLVQVTINGFKYEYDHKNDLLWDETLNSFTRLNFLTENERLQLYNQIKYTHNLVL